ncbi:MAG: SAM-dependent DNA methyltransferase [Euryarchaeota archaeon]|nr:SAM-dependent DNA methyltransferase [Euryarchaeota archaeon]
MTIHLAEQKRLKLQSEIDSKKSQLERNKLGQFATPPHLAADIVKYIVDKKLLGSAPIHFLDPAIGTGAFYYALVSQVKSGKIASARGIEIDKEVANTADRLWSGFGLNIENDDFFNIRSPTDEQLLPNLILTNPPYVRHHHIPVDKKEELQAIIKTRLGYQVNGLSGLYCYFLLHSHNWLRNQGFGVWLIPSEFMDVNYGEIIKKYLSSKVTLKHIHRFDPNDVQFNDALVSSSIVIYQKVKPNKSDKVQFTYGGNITDPTHTEFYPIIQLTKLLKWSQLPRINGVELIENNNTIQLSQFFRIQRGIATGANSFFIITRDKAKAIGIPDRFVKSILPGPKKLNVDVIEPDKKKFPQLDTQLVVIDCNISESNIQSDYPGFAAYLNIGHSNKIVNRYLLTKRDIWYHQEQRDPAPFLCTYMGRNDKPQPFRFIWNRSNAIATNVYLMLYPKGILLEALTKMPHLYPAIFKFLKELKMTDMIGNGRVYGGGLYKIEPKELGRLSASGLLDILTANNINIQTQKKITGW